MNCDQLLTKLSRGGVATLMKANITLDVPTDVKLSIHGISNEHENICKNHNIANNYTGHRYSIQRNDTIILELTYGISQSKLGNHTLKGKEGQA